jgi:hypothetical protein
MSDKPERPLPDFVFGTIIVVLVALALLPRCVPDVIPGLLSASSAASPRQGSKLAR